jgi:hypothetical protein
LFFHVRLEKWMGLGLIFIFAFLLVLWFDFFE